MNFATELLTARVASGFYKPKKVGDSWVCVECSIKLRPRKGMRPRLRCDPCAIARYRHFAKTQQPAATEVARAIARGDLLPPSTYYCVDCGKSAQHYDHRDYTKPLDVVPVCRSCNVRRGPADVRVRA